MVLNKNRSFLRIGRVTYTNLFPIFYMLEKECDCSKYEFIEGFPSNLNRMLRYGEIDISPSSSIEYLRHPNKYTIIEGHSISSRGPIGSILLFSRRPIEELDGMRVLTSSQSESSVALLDIILKKFYKIGSYLRPTDKPLDLALSMAEACLSIGDDALKAQKTVTSYKLINPSTPFLVKGGAGGFSNSKLRSAIGGPNSELIYIYDLGDLWYRNTGLPFVFALWIVRKRCYIEKTGLLERFINDLNKAKWLAMRNLNEIAEELRPLLLRRYSLPVTEDELISFWEGISYDFGDEHKKGLELFRRYLEESDLLNTVSVSGGI